MTKLKKKISLITVFAVTIVAFLGMICPMAEAAAGSEHKNCSNGTITISSPHHSEMANCMSGKLGFLSGLLVSIPENFLTLFALAVFAAAFVSAKLTVQTRFDDRTKARFRYLLFNYLNCITLKYRQTFLSWLSGVYYPAQIA